MDRSCQIMGDSFKRGLNSEVVTFSTILAVEPYPLYKCNWKKARWQPPVSVSCLLIGQNGLTPLQVQFYVANESIILNRRAVMKMDRCTYNAMQ